MKRLSLLAVLSCLVAAPALAGTDAQCTITATGTGATATACMDVDTGADVTTRLGFGFYVVQCSGEARVRGSTEAGKSSVTAGVLVPSGALFPIGHYSGRAYFGVSASAGVTCTFHRADK